MNRREFITLLGGAAAAWPVVARGQERLRRIAVLFAGSESDPNEKVRLAAFKQLLMDLGWIEDQSIRIVHRFAEADPERMRILAHEVVASQPEVIVGAGSTALVTALIGETRTIPVVFSNISDPVGSGVVATLARPGGNATGFVNFEFSMGGKWLELLKELSPGVRRAGIMFNPETVPGGGTYFLQSGAAAGPSFGIETFAASVRRDADIEGTIASLSRETNNGLIVMPDIFTGVHRGTIAEATARHHVPAIYPYRYFAEAGGLLSYGVDSNVIYRQSAVYVDRILRGAIPGDLPVQQPTKFELVINLKTAKALGITVPPKLLFTADEVIE